MERGRHFLVSQVGNPMSALRLPNSHSFILPTVNYYAIHETYKTTVLLQLPSAATTMAPADKEKAHCKL
jgi:hypothetical protein